VLLRVTNGFSGRQLRKLVTEALALKRETVMQPERLTLEEVIQVAQDRKQRMEQDQQDGGVYGYSYEQ